MPPSLVPHFDVDDIRGRRVRYGEIWQRAPLLLVSLHAADPEAGAAYAAGIERAAAALAASGARIVVTRERIRGLPAPAVVVADRWGEIQHMVSGDPRLDTAPDPAELDEWLQHIRMQCPECEGEWR